MLMHSTGQFQTHKHSSGLSLTCMFDGFAYQIANSNVIDEMIQIGGRDEREMKSENKTKISFFLVTSYAISLCIDTFV